MNKLLSSLLLFSFLSGGICAQSQPASKTRAPAPAEPVVQMEPYIVKGERILPPPEDWLYVRVPALELTRGNSKIIVPGFEILSTREKAGTLGFVEELQQRQIANAILFPNIIGALPSHPAIVIILDNYAKMEKFPSNPVAEAWQGDSLYTYKALKNAYSRMGNPQYSVGTSVAFAGFPKRGGQTLSAQQNHRASRQAGR